MGTEIKRNTWSRFCKKFNTTNQLRWATVSVKARGENETAISQDQPFMGIAITKKGRLIDGIELFAARYNPERLAEPVVTVKEPARLVLEKSPDGTDNRLMIQSKDGSVASVALTGETGPQQRQAFVEKLAYSMYERRGCTHGDHVHDWLEAERRVKETELQFV